MKTAILGAGKMGVWFAKFCREKGDEVILSDRKKEKLLKLGKELGVKTTLDFTEAVKAADRIMICVSISSFEDVVKKIGSSVRDFQTVMDICSVKEFPVRVMHENIKHGLILGTHPVFGPGSTSIKHKAYILTPTTDAETKFADSFKKWLEKEEAHVFIMTPRKHDQLMSTVLGLPHFVGLVACETLLEQRDFSEMKQVSGTTYRMLFTLAESTALETPDLYANLQANLPQLGKIENLFISKAHEWLNIIEQKNTQVIIERMEQLKTKLLRVDPDFAGSYEVMYRMLEATEK
jgi:prephenate dehydrogenase